MRDHNLDDLILDGGSSSTRRAKNLLTLLALFIVVLIVGIVFYKIFLAEQHPNVAKIEQNDTIPVSSDLALKHDPGTAIADEETDTSDFIEIPERKTPPAHPVSAKPTQKPTVSPVKPHPVKKSMTAPRNKSVTQPKAQATQTKKSSAKATLGARYYIQVGSFSKRPPSDSPLLATIRRLGYRYTIYRAKGMYKILVGPYKTRAEADRAIGNVRAHIARGAFVFTK